MRFLRNINAVLVRELKRIWAFPSYMMLLTVLPVISFAFFAVVFENGIPHDLPIAVLDEDHSSLSRTLTQMIDAAPETAVRYGVTDMDEGEKLIREGKIHAVVLIPSFFEKSILSNTQTHVEAYVSGVNILTNGLITKDLQTTVTTFGVGIQLQILMKQGLTEAQAMSQAMPVRFDKHVLFNPYTNYGYYLSPSFMPMMLLIFVIMTTIFAVGTELKRGTAGEWFATGGDSVAASVAGKLLPITVVMFLVAMAMLCIIFKVVGVPLNGSLWVILLATLLFIVSYQAIGLFIVALLSNLRLSLSIGGGYSVLAFTFSGLTFPVMAMWPAMQYLSRLFPFTYYTDIFVDQMLRGAPVVCSLPDLGYMSLFILLPFLCRRRLRRICTEEKFWGRL